MMEAAMQGTMPQLPDWYWGGMFFSFMDIYPMGAMDLFGTTEFFGYNMDYPWFINGPIIFCWFILLSGMTFLASLIALNRKDI